MQLPRHIAPAGTPIGAATLIGAGLDALFGRDAEAELTAAIQGRYAVKHCLTVSSGRAALTLILRTLKRLRAEPDRTEIVVPGYTCYSVAAAAVLAGLRLRIVDIDPRTLSYDRGLLENLDFSRVLAILSSNLYGLPNELDFLERLARDRGVFMVDDAAQAMHARYRGRYVGTFGDVGIYSFDKGKNITSLQGGAIVTGNDAIAAALRAEIGALPRARGVGSAAAFMKLSAYTLLLRPNLYWIPAGIPALGLGKTVYTTDIPMHRLSTLAAALVGRLFTSIDFITGGRVHNALRLRESLEGIGGLAPIEPLDAAEPVYLRLPCLVDDPHDRDELIRRLNRAGIGATGSFPRPLCDLPEIAGRAEIEQGACHGARRVAAGILTLPTLAYLRGTDIQRLTAILRAR